MGVYQIFAFIAALVPARAFGVAGAPLPGAGSRRAWAAYASALAIVAAFLGYLLLFDRAVVEARAGSALASLPLRFIDVIGHESARPYQADLLLGLALIEAAALGCFLFHLGALGARERGLVPLLVGLALGVAALVTPATDSGDPYFYVGLATLGSQAYAPPGGPFPGDLHAINAIWGTPMYASTYGPVWIAVSALLVAPLATLGAKLFAFKVLGLTSLVACVVLARRLGAAPAVVAGIACNPALYLAYVAGAHNDLFCVALVLAAMLAARSNVAAAFAFALAASLVKPTLAPVALVALAGVPSLRTRAVFAICLAFAVAGVYAVHGGLMFHALVDTVRAFAHPVPPADLALRLALVVVALASGAWTVLRGRVRAQTAWAPPAFAGSALPSYAVWGLPLALTSAPVALSYLVTLPLLTFFQCTALPVTRASDLAGDLFVLATIGLVAFRLRPGRPAAPLPAPLWGEEGPRAGR
jgi:hypothetical protein